MAFEDTIHLFDGFPLPVCHFRRAGYSKTFHAVVTHYNVTSANVDERDVLPELTEDMYGLLIADKGLIRPELKEALANKGISLETPLRSNMKDERPLWFVKQIVSLRRLVKTVIGQLTGRFEIECIKAKKLRAFLRMVIRKILAHTIALAINKTINPDNPLQFEHLVTT